MVVMAAATSSIIEASPFIVHQPLGCARHRRMTEERHPRSSRCGDYGPGIDAECSSPASRAAAAGRSLRVPLRNPLRAVPAEGARREARRGVRVPALGRRRAADEAVHRARPGQGRRAADRHRRRDRRRHPERDGRRGARRRHLAPLFGRARLGGEQGVRRSVRQGEQRDAAQLHGGRRLRRDARDYTASRPRARRQRWSRR